jgi:STE24 endopeptidase
MSPQFFLWTIAGILIFNYVSGHLLELLNLSRIRTDLPSALTGLVSEEKYRKAQHYSRIRSYMGLFTSTLSFSLTLVALFSGFFGWLDGQLRHWADQPFYLALLFFVCLYAMTELAGLPFHFFNTFVIEKRFGFNKMTPLTFITDKIKGWTISFFIGGSLLWLFHLLLQELGDSFWLWFWGATVIGLLGMVILYPSLLLLFNRLTPLEAGPLREAIESYCRRVNFPVGQVVVIDASRRSTKTNAFFSGFGRRRRIVLYDTLVQQHPVEEIVAIVAHEVGHYSRRHVIQNLLLSSLQIGLMLFLFSRMVNSTSLSFALGADQAGIHLNLLAFVILYSPLSHILSLFVNLNSRKNEFQADKFAAETSGSESVKTALVRLYQHNLTNLTPHPAYVFVNYSHPPLMSRLSALS